MQSNIHIGRFTSDPELRQTKNGVNYVKFRLAVNRKVKKEGKLVDQADFFDYEAWDTGAELIARHFKKGHLIIVHCSAKTDEYEKDGQRIRNVVFRVDKFDFPLNPKPREQAVVANVGADDEEDDDIPF